MKKFLVLYKASPAAFEQMMKSTPEQHKAVMDKWMAWGVAAKSSIVDMGSPLANAQKVSKAGVAVSGSTVIGYSILQAENKDQAVAMLKDHPHLAWMDSCEIEVHETMPLPGM